MKIPASVLVGALLLSSGALSFAVPASTAPATPFKSERAAPASAITFDGNQRKDGYIEVPSVTLRSDGD